MKIINDKGISHVKGYQAIGLYCGIKKNKHKDLCLIYSTRPAVAAATFTTNLVKAAPVLVDMQHIQSDNIQALIINSGNANACTGEAGFENAVEMAKITGTQLGIRPYEVLVYSTGVIGVPLPMDKIKAGIIEAAKSLVSNGEDCAQEAIMTTDTYPKKIFAEVEIGGKTVSIAGIAKGSGMIHPNMATMLSYVVTDANITKEMLEKMQIASVDKTFNMISVDGDTSTNDTATIMANGAAENPIIDCENEDYMILKDAIHFVNETLAKMIVKDGEGATKLIEVIVTGARTEEDARKCAKSVISSNLVKTAIFGSDANWGRVICAMGYSGGQFEPSKVDLSFSSIEDTIQVFSKGTPLPFDEDLAYKILCTDTITMNIELNEGSSSAKAWGCDLTYEYVRINGDYRT